MAAGKNSKSEKNSKSDSHDDDHGKGGRGNDTLAGNDGNDHINGRSGDDTISGGGGNDRLNGGKGNDTISGGDGNDRITGGKGNDTLAGDAGDDRIEGDKGDDTLSGGAGNDRLEGGKGNDTLVYNAALNVGAHDVYDGDKGNDTLLLNLTREEWFRPEVQADIARFLAWLDRQDDHDDHGNNGHGDHDDHGHDDHGHDDHGHGHDDHEGHDDQFHFTAFDLTVRDIENLRVTVDGIELDPRDEAVTAVDDSATTDENAAVTGSVLDNDLVPDLVQDVRLVSDVARGALTLGADGAFSFDPGAAFDYLAAGESTIETFTYEVEDADGDTAQATMTLTVTGSNDGPVITAADTSGAAVELTDADADENTAVHAAAGAIAFADLDLSDAHTVSAVAQGVDYLGTFSALVADGSTGDGAGSIDWNFSVNDSALDSLAAGDVLVQSYAVSVDDGHGGTATETVTVTLTGTNDAPVIAGVSDAGAVSEDDTLAASGDLDSSDVDVGATAAWSVVGGSAGTYGSLGVDAGTGEWTYTLNNDAAVVQALAVGETHDEMFTVLVTDDQGATDSHDVTVTVTGTNDEPEISGDTAGTVSEDGTLVASGDLDSFDVDNGATAAWSVVGGGIGAYGALAVDSDTGEWTYALDNDAAVVQALAVGETLDEVFTVVVTDDQGATDSHDVTVTVTGTNDTPEAMDDVFTTDEDTSITFAQSLLKVNDTDIDGDNLAVISLSGESHGTVTTEPGGLITFTPDADFNGIAGFNYLISDGNGGTDVGHVVINVTPVNDAPVIGGGDAGGAVTAEPVAEAPVATPIVFTVEQYVGVSSNDFNFLSTYAANNPANYTVQTGVIDFTDDPAGFAGELPGSFPWPAEAATGQSGTGSSVNNNFFARITTEFSVTNADTYTFRTFNDDGVQLKIDGITIISDTTFHPESPFEGSIALAPGNHSLELFFFEGGGEASLELSVRDSSGSFGLLGANGGGLGGTALELTDGGVITFTDVDLTDGHTVDVVPADSGYLGAFTVNLAAPATGGATGEVAWAFAVDNDALVSLGADDILTQTYTVSVDDGNGGIDTQEVTVTINGTNDGPVAGDDAFSVDEDGVLNASVAGNDSDVDGDALSFALATGPAHGSIVFNADGSFDYTPNANDYGTDSFTYVTNDGNGGTDVATVELTVNPVNDAPMAVDDALGLAGYSFNEATGHWYKFVNTPVTWAQADILAANEGGYLATIASQQENDFVFNLLDPFDGSAGWLGARDAGAEGQWQWVEGPEAGTTFWQFGGTVSGQYSNWNPSSGEPNNGAGGNEDNLQMWEGTGGTWNDASDASQLGYVIERESAPSLTSEDAPVVISPATLLANDTDVDGDALTVTSVSNAMNGTVALVAGQITFTPDADFNGVASFDYTVDDSNGGTDTASVMFNVAPVNDAPVADDDAFSVDEDGVLNASVAGNDSDVDGDALSFALATGPAHGSIVFNADGSFDYTPNANDYGTDSFTYVTNDGNGGTDAATVELTVNPVNDAPMIEVPASNLALSFNGAVSGDEAAVGAAVPLAGQSFSWEFSVNRAGNLGAFDSNVVFNDNPATFAGNGNHLHVGYRSPADGSGHFTFAFFNNDLNYVDPAGASAGVGSFVHWAGTYDAATGVRQLFKDGTLVAQDNAGVNAYGGPGNLRIGTDFNGSVDFLRIWDGVRSAADIASSAAGDVPTSYATALLAYEFNEAGGGTIIDQSPAGNDGTVSGAARVTIGAVDTSVDEEATLIVSGVTVEDVDGDAITLSLNAADGDVSLTDTTNLVVIDGDGSDGTFVVQGSLADLNAALSSSIAYTGNQDFFGADILVVTADDGNGGTDAASIDLTVNPVNDAPVIQSSLATDGGLLNNGSFESALNASTDWKVAGPFANSDIDRVGTSTWQQADGSFSLDLNGFHPGGVVQTVTTTAGQLYAVEFNLSKNPGFDGFPDPVETVRVSADGTTQDFTYNTPNAASNMQWEDELFVFTATDNSTDLSFVSTDPGQNDSEGPALDGVSMVAVAFEADDNNDLALHGISFTDVDAGQVTAAFSVQHGALTLADTQGLDSFTGDGTSSLTLTGTLAEVNEAVDGMLYGSDSGFTGIDHMNVQVSDLGNAGSGGPLTDSESYAIYVHDYLF